MKHAYSILVVDDEESICRLLQKELAVPHRRIDVAFGAREALERCRQESFEVIILDIRLPDGNGVELVPRIQQILPGAKIIMITGYADVDTAVAAMRNGAYDFIAKPFTLGNVELTIERAFETIRLERENKSLRLSSDSQEQTLIGQSPVMRQVRYLMDKVTGSDIPVLITGESGTGKDVVACALHRASQRASLPMVVKNCACLQAELARSELFGHIRGAFTNATAASEGLLALAHRGTLFLDEIGEISLDVQAQLLRVLESRRYRRVGDKEERSVDVRFIFATSRNLARQVQAGRVHEAFYHRINVFQIHLPPLKERAEDIPLLVRYFLERLSAGKQCPGISPEAMEYLMRYAWPGNVRELRNVIERGIILAENGRLTEHSLPRELMGAPPASSGAEDFDPPDLPQRSAAAKSMEDEAMRLEDQERQHIVRVLNITGGNKYKAAGILGISRKTLYRKIQRLNIP